MVLLQGMGQSAPGHPLLLKNLRASLHAGMKNKRHQNDKLLGEKIPTLSLEASIFENLCLL